MDAPALSIDYALCKECGICTGECPHHRVKSGHSHVDHNFEFCDRCLHCYAVCPEHAIVPEGEGVIPDRRNLDPDTLLAYLMYRRSYRRFTNERLSEEALDCLLNAARYMPSGGNDHRLHITLLTSPEKRAELLEAIHAYYKGIVRLLKNPLLRVIAKRVGDPKVKATLNDPFNYKKILYAIGQMDGDDDAVFYNAPAVFFFHTDRIMPTAREDCLLSAYNVVLMSETLGLGSCLVSLSQQAVTNSKNCKKILAIPSSHRVESVVVVGRPRRMYLRPAVRSPKPVTII